jgi:hypothetical protein
LSRGFIGGGYDTSKGFVLSYNLNADIYGRNFTTNGAVSASELAKIGNLIGEAGLKAVDTRLGTTNYYQQYVDKVETSRNRYFAFVNDAIKRPTV